jgi:hypothetical protein
VGVLGERRGVGCGDWVCDRRVAALDAPEARPKVFYRGYDVYDQAKLGFVSDVPAADGQIYSRYDTSVPGNANSGHVYGTTLSDDDKRAVVEYLKTF